MSDRLRPWIAASAAGALVLLTVGCGSGGDDDTAPGSSTSTTTTTLAGSSTDDGLAGEEPDGDEPFCASIQGIQGLSGTATEGATPDQVLAQTDELVGLLDEAAATVPEGAPADVEALIDDYRSIAEAIGAAGGDVDAAYAAIQETQPRLAARLFDETAHLPAFDYFERRCGVRVG